jgi:Fe-S oxidoreductase
MGMVEPRLKRRRGTQGLYAQPRNLLSAIPGLNLVELIRIRENSFCCGAGRGTREAYPDLATFSAQHRMEEVTEVGAEALISACPFCKMNFANAAKQSGNNVKVMDIAEVISASIG